MINVNLEKHCNKFVSFHIEGHAGFDEEGRDIVSFSCSVFFSIQRAAFCAMFYFLNNLIFGFGFKQIVLL